MPHTIKILPKSTVEFTITVTPTDYRRHLESAVEHIGQVTAIKGFRKGKAPYEIIKKQVGEMKILQEALEAIIKDTFYKAVLEEKLETVGMPKIDVEKLAPGNDVVYKATVALLPKVTLPTMESIDVQYTLKPPLDSKITETLDAIRGMHATEVVKVGEALGTDKIVLDLNMFADNVPVEGGQAKNHQVYLSEKHYIPGFNEEVTGLKKGDEKKFTLHFPKNHYQKHLAGKKIDFEVKVNEVFERQLPELSDELAKKLGQESVGALKERIKNNLFEEAKRKEDQRVEIAILDALIEKSTIDEIPDILVDTERQKMFQELKRDLEKNNIPIEKYLEDIKKTEKDLYQDFKHQAEKRAKAALISRQIALEYELQIDKKEIDGEIEMMKDVYKDNKEYLENLKHPEVRDSIATHMQNRKVMLWLTSKIVGKNLIENDQLSKMGCVDCAKDKSHEHTHS